MQTTAQMDWLSLVIYLVLGSRSDSEETLFIIYEKSLPRTVDFKFFDSLRFSLPQTDFALSMCEAVLVYKVRWLLSSAITWTCKLVNWFLPRLRFLLRLRRLGFLIFQVRAPNFTPLKQSVVLDPSQDSTLVTQLGGNWFLIEGSPVKFLEFN